MALNKFLCIGRVGSDPEVKYLEGGGKFARLNIAIDEKYKDRNGEVKENTEWVSVSVWGKTSDFVENYVKRGSQVFVEGKLHNRKYTDKSGFEKAVTEIVADNIQFVGSKEKQEDAPAQRPSKPAFVPDPIPASPKKQEKREEPIIIDDDLPF